MFNSN